MPKNESSSDASINIIFILALSIHFLDLFLRLSGVTFTYWHPILLAYIILAIIASAGPLGREKGNLLAAFLGKKFFDGYLFLTLLAYSIPLINLISYDLKEISGVDIQAWLGGIIIFAPIWLMYLMYSQPSRITQKLGTIYVIAWVLIFFFSYTPQIRTATQDFEIPGIMPGYTLETISSIAWKGIKDFGNQISEMPDKLDEWWERQLATARGEQYKGDIEKASKERLGVFIDDITTTRTEFKQDEEIKIKAKMHAKVLDNTINIKFTCHAENIHGRLEGTTQPQTITVQRTTDRTINCNFPNKEGERFNQGTTSTIKFKTAFDFDTGAYSDIFFMSEDRLNKLLDEKKDPFRSYGVEDTSGKSIFTEGPMHIGSKTGIENSPIPIDLKQQKFEDFISLSFANRLEGKIKNINKLLFVLPKEFKAQKISGKTVDNSWKKDCSGIKFKELKVCNNDIETVYEMPQQELKKLDVEKIINLDIDYEITQQDRISMLKDTPLASRSIKTFINYNYEIDKEIPIFVKGEKA